MTRDRWNSTASRLALAAAFATAVASAPFTLGEVDGDPIAVNAAAAQSADDSGGDDGSGDDDGGGISADIGADIGGIGVDAGADIGSGGIGADVGADIGGGDEGGSGDGSSDGDGSSSGDGSSDGDGSGSGDGSSDGDGSSSGGGSNGGTGSPGSEADGAESDAGAGVEDAEGASADADGDFDRGRGDRPGIRSGTRPFSYFSALDVGTPAFDRYSTAARRNDLQAAGDALSAATNRPVTSELVEYVNAELDVQTALTARQIAAAANGVPAFSRSEATASTPGGFAGSSQ